MKRKIFAAFATFFLAGAMLFHPTQTKAVDNRCDQVAQACDAVADVNYAICRTSHTWLFCNMNYDEERSYCRSSQECPVMSE